MGHRRQPDGTAKATGARAQSSEQVEGTADQGETGGRTSLVAEAANVLVRDLVGFLQARGFWEKAVPWLMQGYLADAFDGYCGDAAIECARLFATWTTKAVKELEAR